MSTALAPLAGEGVFPFTPTTDLFLPAVCSLAPGDPDASGPISALGDLAVAQPVHAGDEVAAFGADFFERVHYSFKLADLGNVIGLQTVTLYVWNAFRRSEKLLAFTPTNDDGIVVSGGPPALPFDFAALREVAYTFAVSTDGPATVDATYAFDWQTADDSVRITGSRITAWTFLPDWSNGVVERLEWLTDVLPSYNGKEQRRALRLAPRKAYEFDAFLQGRERRYAEAAMWGWGARTWALPIWTDGQETTAPLSIGATEILCTTATRDFAAGSLAMLIADAFTFETVEVDTVLADRLVLARGLTLAWPANTRLYPARTARISGGASLPRWSGDAAGMRLAFDLSEPVDHAASAGATTFRSYPVITRRPNWTGGLSLDLQRKLAEIDGLTGARTFDDESGLPAPAQRMRWTLTTRAEVDEFRALLYALRGRQGAAWVPTWTDDLSVVATIDLAASAIDVDWTAYTRQIALSTGRRDIRIETTAGQVFYRRIESASQISTSVERLTIDSALGVTLTPAQILQVSFMALMRLDGDSVELAHWTGEAAEVATVWKGFQHDV